MTYSASGMAVFTMYISCKVAPYPIRLHIQARLASRRWSVWHKTGPQQLRTSSHNMTLTEMICSLL